MSLITSSIVDLNNQAIASMKKGDLNETVGTLGTALSNLTVFQDLENCFKGSMMEQQLQFNGTYSTTATPTCASAAAESLPAALLRNSCASSYRPPPMSSVLLTPPEHASSSASIFGLFHRALTIPEGTVILPGSTDRVMAMLLFNLGLTMHMQALNTGRTAELDGALRLYEMSFSVVEDAWSKFDNMDDLMLMIMVLCNNMGHIHSSRFDATRGRICLDWLKTLAANPVFQSLMSRPEYSAFFMNLLVALKQEAHTCSPAA